MVPNGWEQKSFKDILKLDRGSSPRPIVNFMTDSDDGVNWIKIGDTKGEAAFINSTKEKITKEGAKKSREVSKGEIILSNSMSYGKPYILNIDGYIHDGWFVIRNYEQNLDKGYLIQLLGGEIVQRQYKRLAAGGVVTNISSELVYFVKVNLPPLPEQRKIAKILSTWDKAISTTERLIDNSKQQKKALMQQLLTGKKRLLDDSGKPFEGEWEEVKLADVVEFNNGKGHEKHIVEDGKYLVVNSKYISSDGLVKKTTDSAFCLANVGDVLMVMSDVPNGKAIAKCLYVDTSEKFTVNQRVARFRPKSINSIFLYYTLNRNSYYLQFDDGVKQTNLRKDEVLDCPVFRPSDEEQQKIASVLVNADQEIELLEQQLADLKQEKKALMQQLLTGKRRVKVDDKEVA